MKKHFLLLGFVFLLGSVSSQQLIWKAGVHSFFDNVEFAGSQLKESQTMAGVHLAPEIGVGFDSCRHRLSAGLDAMHEFGSNRVIGYIDLIAYYQFEGKPFRFYMGAFPRENVLDRYPRMFFSDSIRNYRPVITGFFWEIYSPKKDYLNIWLDWTGRQSTLHNEAFFMGWSGRYNLGLFYGQHFGYMYHFAAKKNPAVPEGLHDNGLLLTQLGIDLKKKTGFEKLEAGIGWSLAADRERGNGGWHAANGLYVELKAEYRGIGIENTYYRGNRGQQYFYADHSNLLYWGDPAFRAREYNRTDLYIVFLKSDLVNVEFRYALHFAERQLYHEQQLKAVFDIGKPLKKTEKAYRFVWDNWFKKR